MQDSLASQASESSKAREHVAPAHPVNPPAKSEPDGRFSNVTVISVTYQSAAIAPAMAATLALFANVIVVDNASQDGTADLLAQLLPDAKIIRNMQNKGFGTANNQGMAMVKTPFALMLNPDCEIDAQAMERLLSCAAMYPNAALIAPQGWRKKDEPQPSYRQAFYDAKVRLPYRIPDGPCSAKWLHGCCLLTRTEMFHQFGGFDERFFLFYEDDDLCLRALNAGYDRLLEPSANVMHVGAAASAPSLRTDFIKGFYLVKSRHLILSKYVGRRAAMKYRIKTMLAGPPAALIYALLGQRKYAIRWLAWGCSAWTRQTDV